MPQIVDVTANENARYIRNELELIEIVILWVYYTIPFGLTLFWHFLASLLIF